MLRTPSSNFRSGLPPQIPLWKRRPAVVVLTLVSVVCIISLVMFSRGSSSSSRHILDDSSSSPVSVMPKRNRRARYSRAPARKNLEHDATAGDPVSSSPSSSTASPRDWNEDPSPPMRKNADCRHHEGACVQADGSLILPNGYPVHRNLPPRKDLLDGLQTQRAKKCDAASLLKKSPLLMLLDSPRQKQHLADDDDDEADAVDHHNQPEAAAGQSKVRRSLEKEFGTPLGRQHKTDKKLFAFTESEINEAEMEFGGGDSLKPWWVAFDGDISSNDAIERLPCTAEVQALLHRWQHPPEEACMAGDNGGDVAAADPDLGIAGTVRGLVSELKAGAHGVGSAVTLLAHDFLSALILRRRFTVATRKRRPWYFAPQGCETGGWECMFLPPTSCYFRWGGGGGGGGSKSQQHQRHRPPPPVHTIPGISQVGNKRLVQKKSFDVPGLSRSDYPSLESFFSTLGSLQRSERRSSVAAAAGAGGYHDQLVGQFLSSSSGGGGGEEHVVKEIAGKCIPLIKDWARDPANRILMGTFRKGTDPVLVYQLAQATAYLMRGLQPWFRQVIAAHLRKIVLANPSRRFNLKRRIDDTVDHDVLKTGRLKDRGGAEGEDAAGGIVLARGKDGKLHAEENEDAAAAAGAAGRTAIGNIEEEVHSVIFVHDRGELAKYREYYNAIGCHKLRQEAFLREVTHSMCPSILAAVNDAAAGGGGGGGGGVPRVQIAPDIVRPQRSVKKNKCIVFISGNMPRAEYLEMVQRVEGINSRTRKRGRIGAGGGGDYQLVVRSTWELKSEQQQAAAAAAAETARWGAAHPAASWVDLFAGMHSTGWSCIVQSNWCRVIGFVRMTLMARANCPFVDMGIAALADDEIPNHHCIVRDDWPKKPYSGGATKDFALK